MEKIERYFPKSYEESRETFRGHLDKIKDRWPSAELVVEQVGEEADNTIDMIYSEATETNDNVLFFTTGEHGIEGYAGAAVTHMFVEEYIDRIDPATTGICFVHALNPWGMKHFRRVTENNVDLNRHYVHDSVQKDINEKFEKESDLFLPNGKINDLDHEKKKLYAQLAKGLAKEGYNGIKEAKGMGQFQFERGVYYGGKHEEEPAAFLKKIQRDLLSNYPRVIHMDWHTALGPTNELTMVISEQDPREQEELEEAYKMKNIEKFTPTKVKGDSTYHFHKLKNEDYQDTYLFSALFEFGTFGTGKKAELRELMTIVLENHLYFEGAEKPEDRKWIQEEFRAMFYPKEKEWLTAVLKEARGGIESVLTKEEILH